MFPAFSPIRGKRIVLLGHHHQRRAQQAIVEHIALLEHLHHAAGATPSGASTWLMAWWCSGLKARRPGRARSGRCRRRPSAAACRVSSRPSRSGLVSLPARGQAGVQAVEHRQQVAQQALVGELARLLDISRARRLRWFSRSARSSSTVAAQLLQFGAQGASSFVGGCSGVVWPGRFGHGAVRGVMVRLLGIHGGSDGAAAVIPPGPGKRYGV
jgi:hypothetical protein